ncbi:permease [Massilia sp. ST3]|uniref:permease n=1 Tax=Massilia sp. ST3 TaxID=2824903 RepID=UPI001B83D1C7|nr:permease [Massilia sp. ST3]MBQ5948503.1 permease [Massilia sp. ST3]
MQRSLTYTAMPPIQVPLPFLLAAPCFALAAALLLAWQGETALASRWSPVTLAMTHLLTLGFLTMTIVGALFQLLPVVAGVGIPLARPVAALSWSALALGTVLLAGALGLGLGPAAYQAAAGVLGLAGFVILAAVGTAISHKIVPAARPLVRGVRLASAGLAVTIGLGASLALYLSGMGPLDAPLLTDIHASWGLVGWVVALTATVSFQVIPMFQGTPAYPRSLESWLPAALVALVAGWSAAALAGVGPLRLAAEAGVALLLLRYAGATLLFFRKRKRAADVGTYYWVLAMGSLALAALVHFLPLGADQRPLLSGILVIAGFGMSAVNGMLYKIVPFLVWYHLQSDPSLPRERVPALKNILDGGRALRQWRWHVVALGLLAAAPFAPAVLARPAGLFQALALLLLIRDLGGAAGLYLSLRRPPSGTVVQGHAL